MDNLCHTLTGAAMGKAGLARRTRFGMATLMVAANLPDVDVAVFLTDTLPVSFRRGWTHGVLAQVALPIVLAAVVWIAGRVRPISGGDGPDGPGTDFRQLLLLSYLGLYSHIFMDWLNSYGVRLLMPFSGRCFYGDALYIVDPWLYLVLAGGLWLASRAARRGAPDPRRPARDGPDRRGHLHGRVAGRERLGPGGRARRKTIAELNRAVRALANTSDYRVNVALLRTVPGISTLTAMLLLTELYDMTRFKTHDTLCSYVGLIPNTNSSGEKYTKTGMTNRRNGQLRAAIIESAWTAVRKDPALMLAFNELCKHMTKTKAIIRIARKLLSRIRYVLKNQQAYVPAVIQ